MTSPSESADLVLYGTILTVDDTQPTAEALFAVSGGRIVAVGSRAEVAGWVGERTDVREVDGCVMPGFVEAHGHPLMEAVALSGRIVDIRPVTLPSAGEVLDAIHAEVAQRGADGAFLNGWTRCCRTGCCPTRPWPGWTASRPRHRW